MPVIKRYFHCSQELIADPEVWEMINKFGDRFILTWLQILIYLERTDNHWRLSGDWLAVLSRSVRQSSAKVRLQVGELMAKEWLLVGEVTADGLPLVLNGRNWSKYNNRREHEKKTDAPLRSVPNPSVPNPPVPNTKIKKEEEKIKTCEGVEKNSAGPVVPAVVTTAQQVWERYREAYVSRYQAEPVRNATVNGQIAQLVKRIGGAAAPEVAAFYVWHNDQFYVRNQHPIGLLLKSCEGLHTQWVKGQTVTASQARKIDETSGRVNVFQELINERNGVIIDVKTS